MTNLYLDDKMHDARLTLDAVSNCCSAPTNSDIMICSDCKEHCDIYYEADDDTIDQYNNNKK